MQFWNPAIPGYIRPDVDPPKRVTLATWGLLPTCKQALIILGAINLGAFSKSVASLFRFRREGLLSLAALQICRRNFPRVGFIQSRTVLLMRRQTNPITPHETWLNLFWSKLCIFCGLYFDFVLSPVFKDKPLVGVFFLHLGTLPRSDFPGSHGAKKHYRLVLFWARAIQSFLMRFFAGETSRALLSRSLLTQKT